MRKHYIALVHKDDETGFGVSFPDFPDAATTAPLDEAVERAGKALASQVLRTAYRSRHPAGLPRLLKTTPTLCPYSCRCR
jgi:hypothetical protein